MQQQKNERPFIYKQKSLTTTRFSVETNSIYSGNHIINYLVNHVIKLGKHGFREHVLEHFHVKIDRIHYTPQTTTGVDYIEL